MIIPKKMREDLGYAVKDVSDVNHKELTPGEVLEIFEKDIRNIHLYLRLQKFISDRLMESRQQLQ